MKPKSDAVIETQIFRVHGIAMNDALTKCHGLAVATPDEEAHSVRHHLPKSAEVILSQLFEMQLRTLIDVNVEREDLIDNLGDVGTDVQFDRHVFSRPELLA